MGKARCERDGRDSINMGCASVGGGGGLEGNEGGGQRSDSGPRNESGNTCPLRGLLPWEIKKETSMRINKKKRRGEEDIDGRVHVRR